MFSIIIHKLNQLEDTLREYPIIGVFIAITGIGIQYIEDLTPILKFIILAISMVVAMLTMFIKGFELIGKIKETFKNKKK